MKDLLQDTAFGRLLCFFSRGRYLQFQEYHDKELLDKYLSVGGPQSVESNEAVNAETEKGENFILIDWIENDPAVRGIHPMLC